EPLARLSSGRGERLVALNLLRGERGFGARRAQLRLCLRDRGLLLGDLGTRGLSRGRGRFDLAGDLLGLCAILARVEFGQRLPLPDRLVLGDQDTLDVSGDLRGHHDRIRRDIGVIGALHVLPARLTVEVPEKAGGNDRDRADEQRKPNAWRLERGTPALFDSFIICCGVCRLIRHVLGPPNCSRDRAPATPEKWWQLHIIWNLTKSGCGR